MQVDQVDPERRLISRQLQRWTRQLTQILGLEELADYAVRNNMSPELNEDENESNNQVLRSQTDESLLSNVCTFSPALKTSDVSPSAENETAFDRHESFLDSQMSQAKLKPPSESRTSPPVSNAASSRKCYTKERLDRAIADIQSGRIGTRKASTLYGIPRSTLRNKVIRIKQNQLNQLKSIEEALANQAARMPVACPPLPSPGPSEFYAPSAFAAGTSSQLAESAESRDEDMFSHVIKSILFARLAEATDFARIIDERRTLLASKKPLAVNKSLRLVRKRVLRRTVMKKFKDKPLAGDAGLFSSEESAVESSEDSPRDESMISPVKDEPFVQSWSGKETHTTAGSSSSSSKQRRAKRGQYRRYDVYQLDKAVEAVINGSLSVHKAGNYFGVPHSTLEYKVKEKMSSSSSSKTASSSSTLSDSPTDDLKENDFRSVLEAGAADPSKQMNNSNNLNAHQIILLTLMNSKLNKQPLPADANGSFV